MPFVNIRTAKGILDEARRRALHERITEALVEIEGGGDPDFRRYVQVLIEEHEPAAWSMGGTQITPEIVAQIGGRAAQAPRAGH